MDARDIFDDRRERAAEMNMRVSCSVIGEGPGTGGSGADGGAESGCFAPGEETGEMNGEEAGGGRGDPGTPTRRGDGGMKAGGTGKESSRSGTVSRLSRERVSVVDVEAMIELAVNQCMSVALFPAIHCGERAAGG